MAYGERANIKVLSDIKLSHLANWEIREKVLKCPKLKPGECITVDLSYSNLTDTTLSMLVKHMLRNRINSEGIVFNLRGCQGITLKSIEGMTRFNYIQIDLTDTMIEEEDIFNLRRKNPFIKIDFFPIYNVLKSIFEKGVYSRFYICDWR